MPAMENEKLQGMIHIWMSFFHVEEDSGSGFVAHSGHSSADLPNCIPSQKWGMQGGIIYHKSALLKRLFLCESVPFKQTLDDEQLMLPDNTSLPSLSFETVFWLCRGHSASRTYTPPAELQRQIRTVLLPAVSTETNQHIDKDVSATFWKQHTCLQQNDDGQTSRKKTRFFSFYNSTQWTAKQCFVFKAEAGSFHCFFGFFPAHCKTDKKTKVALPGWRRNRAFWVGKHLSK